MNEANIAFVGGIIFVGIAYFIYKKVKAKKSGTGSGGKPRPTKLK